MSSRSLAIVLLLVVLAPACGRKEPPKPPPSRIPAPINDLSIQQRGQEILLTMTYPSVTLGGLPIEDLEHDGLPPPPVPISHEHGGSGSISWLWLMLLLAGLLGRRCEEAGKCSR